MNRRKKSRYTVWTSPKSEWTRVFEGVEMDEKLQKKLDDKIKEYDKESDKERLSAFETQIHESSLGKSVG